MKKNSLGIFLAMLFCILLLPMQVNAESEDGFQLDNTGVVTLRSQHAAKEKISSLQFSLTVDSAEAAKVEFQFESSNARVVDFRYDENTKKMNVYMAGVDPLFAEDTDALKIGKVVVLDGNGNETDAQITVVDNSLQYVYGTEVKGMDEVELPGTVPIGPSAQATPQPTPVPVPPTQTPQDPEQTPPPVQETPAPDDSNGNDDPNAGWDPGWQNPGNNSQGGGSNATPAPTQTTGGKKTQSTVRVPHKVASSNTPAPSTTPSVSVSPSPEPENTPDPEADESMNIDTDQTEDDTAISASAAAGASEEETSQEETGKKTDWLMIVVVLAIVIFVAVAAISVVVLKGKKNPHDREA